MKKTILILCTFFIFTVALFGVTFPFIDDMESGNANWTEESPWSQITTEFHSSTTSYSDSPNTFYDNDIDVELKFSSALDLTGTTNPQLNFWHNYQIEPGYDFGYVEISTDGGATFPTVLATYSGTSEDPWGGRNAISSKAENRRFIANSIRSSVWKMEQIDLTTYSGESNVIIRFRFTSDEIITWDGWYIDDVAIAEQPTEVVLNAVSNPTPTSLDLDWTQNAGPDFNRYEVYRSLSSDVTFDDDLVAAEYTQSNITYTDTGLNVRTTYYYKVYVVNQNSIYAASNEEYGVTIINVDYPFFDDMENGTNWISDTPGTWTLVEPVDPYSPSHIWDESFESDYQNDIDASLTLTFDLETTENSQITFKHKLEIIASDSAFVEYSLDSGVSWIELDHFTNITHSDWTSFQYNFGIISSDFRLRFRIQTNEVGVADGWEIDDIGVSDLPDEVVQNTPIPQTMPDYDDVLISWSQSSIQDFKQYEIFRSTSANVDSSGTPAGIVVNQIATSFMDSGLNANTVYYYKVFAVNEADAKKGSNEETVTTNIFGGTASYPFFDDMENGLDYWVYSGGFAQTEEDSYSANTSWSESPIGNYNPSMDANLKLTIDLSNAELPILSFWHKYTTQSYADYIRVYISTDGSSWNNHFFMSGTAGIWEFDDMDLSEYVGNPAVTIRFRFTSDGATEYEGWNIDDVRIGESVNPQIPYPFSDNMDNASTEDNWNSSNWELNTGGNSGQCWDDSPDGRYIDNIREQLILSNVIDLSSATHPLISFWHKYQIENYNHTSYKDYAYVQVSNDKGHPGTWTTLATYNGNLSSWTRKSFDLSDYAGQSDIRIRFYLYENGNYNASGWSTYPQGWWIDDVRIEEAPADVTLNTVTNPTMHSAELSWTQNSDTDFAAYEIYRDIDSGVDRTSTLAVTITNQATISVTDIYSVLQPNHYYYSIYIRDTLGNYSPLGSNVEEAIYSVPQQIFPFFDDFETRTTNWAYGNPWSEDTTEFYSESTSWSDSPAGVYDNNVDSSTDTYIDLTTANTPALTFWQKYSLEENVDWGNVQITNNSGASWTTLLSVTGLGGAWNQEQIDLSTYAGDIIGLRFRIVTNGSITSDGWYIDDVSVAEATLVAPYPFTDNVENGIGYWTYDSPWSRVTENSYSGDYSWTDSPGVNYTNSISSSLKLTIDLLTAVKPVLTFRQFHSIETDNDRGFVEVSNDLGISWIKRFYITGTYPDWKKVQIDLTEYAGYDNVMIRFRIVTNSSVQNDGWHIDDISIDEAQNVIPYPLVDAMNDTTSFDYWYGSNWEIINDGHSGSAGFHDSPYGRYPDNSHSSITLANSIDLTGAYKPQLTFWHKYQIENYNHTSYKDYGYVQISSDNGAESTYTTLATYNGNNTTWTQVQLDLTAYAGLENVRIRFLMYENGNYTYNGWSTAPNGWWLDDLRIEDSPRAVTLSDPENVTMHNADISWTMNTNIDFQKYEIYRATDANVDYNDELIASVYTQSDTTYADIYTVLQPNHYYYRIYVVDTINTYDEGSNVVSADYTVPVNNYPFSDDFETVRNNGVWDWNSPWGTTTEFANSGTTSWADSPYSNYPDNYQGCITTFIDLTNAVTPFLTYQQKYELEEDGDYAYVEVSTNSGNSWAVINTMTGNEADWNLERLDMTPYIGDIIGLRFRISTNSSVNYDGWYIDDVNLNEGTRIVSYPFFDDVESGGNAWHYNSPWGITDSDAYSGSSCWTDSPQGSYQNSASTSLKINIDLSSAIMPALSFYQNYSLQINNDFGRIEVSNNNGASWKRLCYVTGYSTGWINEKIDLTEYAGDSFVMIRFRLTTSASTQAEGWFIDDISINEPTVNISFPFADNCDDSTSVDYWLSSSFDQSTGGQEGLCWNENPYGIYLDNTNAALTLANTIDLSNTVNPELTFWHKYQIENYNHTSYKDYGYVQISNNNGTNGTYVTLRTFNGNQSGWVQVSVDLTAYVGTELARIRFYLYENGNYNASGWSTAPNGWWIDGIRIQESTTLNAVDWANLESPASISMNIGDTTPTIYGKVFEPGITEPAGQGAGIYAELGFGPAESNPTGLDWTWTTATYDSDADTCDVYASTLIVNEGGTFDYCYRYRLTSETDYIYADLDGNDLGGGGWNGYATAQSGILEILGEPVIEIDNTSISVGLSQNNSVEEYLWIFNTGDATLDIDISEIENLGGRSGSRIDISWLSANPVIGNIEPGDSLEITVNLNSFGIEDGYHNAYLLISSNDPEVSEIIVDVEIIVGGIGAPDIIDIYDVPDDQGGFVRLVWEKSANDTTGTGFPVTNYSVWRRVDNARTDWDFIESVTAVGSENYDYVAPTLGNSTPQGDFWSVFYVSAHTSYPSVYANSLPDSACSIDNIEPTTPDSLVVLAGDIYATLDWDPIPDPDFNYYAIYRGIESGFTPEYPVGYATDSTYTDYSLVIGDNYYRISAFDIAGNEGVPSQEFYLNFTGPNVEPVTNLSINISGSIVTLNWDPSPTPNVIYIVYEGDAPDGGFAEVTGEGTLNGTSWENTITGETKKFYYVTARKVTIRE